jgi:hypothetical protein
MRTRPSRSAAWTSVTALRAFTAAPVRGVMEETMDRYVEIFKVLLLVAFASQALVDGLGAMGVFYNAYGEDVFSHSGKGALVSFEISFALYLFWMAAYYASLLALSLFHWSAWIIVPTALVLSLISQPISGVYIGTPAELTLTWMAWFSYDLSIAAALFSPAVSSRFRESFREFCRV